MKTITLTALCAFAIAAGPVAAQTAGQHTTGQPSTGQHMTSHQTSQGSMNTQTTANQRVGTTANPTGTPTPATKKSNQVRSSDELNRQQLAEYNSFMSTRRMTNNTYTSGQPSYGYNTNTNTYNNTNSSNMPGNSPASDTSVPGGTSTTPQLQDPTGPATRD